MRASERILGAGTDALETSILRDSEEFGLELRTHFGNFIEKDCAAIGRFKASESLGVPVNAALS